MYVLAVAAILCVFCNVIDDCRKRMAIEEDMVEREKEGKEGDFHFKCTELLFSFDYHVSNVVFLCDDSLDSERFYSCHRYQESGSLLKYSI